MHLIKKSNELYCSTDLALCYSFLGINWFCCEFLPEGIYSHQRPAHRSTTLTTRRYRVTASRSFLDRHSIHMMSFMGRYLQNQRINRNLAMISNHSNPMSSFCVMLLTNQPTHRLEWKHNHLGRGENTYWRIPPSQRKYRNVTL